MAWQENFEGGWQIVCFRGYNPDRADVVRSDGAVMVSGTYAECHAYLTARGVRSITFGPRRQPGVTP